MATRKITKLSEKEKAALRHDYETNWETSIRAIAAKFGLHEATLRARAKDKRDPWRRAEKPTPEEQLAYRQTVRHISFSGGLWENAVDAINAVEARIRAMTPKGGTDLLLDPLDLKFNVLTLKRALDIVEQRKKVKRSVRQEGLTLRPGLHALRSLFRELPPTNRHAAEEHYLGLKLELALFEDDMFAAHFPWDMVKARKALLIEKLKDAPPVSLERPQTHEPDEREEMVRKVQEIVSRVVLGVGTIAPKNDRERNTLTEVSDLAGKVLERSAAYQAEAEEPNGEDPTDFYRFEAYAIVQKRCAAEDVGLEIKEMVRLANQASEAVLA